MTDTELLDWLEMVHRTNEYSKKCAFRFSTTGRGWRLHSTREWDKEGVGAATTVRQAIINAIEAMTTGGQR